MTDRATPDLPISVIVPLYRAEEYYARLGETLAGQGAREVVVVIDDDSQPGAVKAVLDAVPNLRLLRTTGGIGTSAARNKGAEAATQPWVTFLDQDDWWDPGFLARLFERENDGILGYDNLLWSAAEGTPTALGETVFERAGWDRPRVGPAESTALLDGFPMLKLLLRREIFHSVGGYRDVYAVEDFDLVWRLVASGRHIDLVEDPAGNYLLQPDSTTNRVRTDREAFERAQRSWVRIWFDMARAEGLARGVRLTCLRKSATITARIGLRFARRILLERRLPAEPSPGPEQDRRRPPKPLLRMRQLLDLAGTVSRLGLSAGDRARLGLAVLSLPLRGRAGLSTAGVFRLRIAPRGFAVADRSDFNVMVETLVANDFDLPLGSPQTIVDAGAHAGLFSLYLHDRFPDARIIAAEPAPSTFRRLSRNVAGIAAISPHELALAAEESSGRFRENELSWGSALAEDGDVEVSTVTLRGLLDRSGLAEVDLLKIDIEGAEWAVFESERDLAGAAHVIGELHCDPTDASSFFQRFPNYSVSVLRVFPRSQLFHMSR
jgi:FkbM family methyltransferase